MKISVSSCLFVGVSSSAHSGSENVAVMQSQSGGLMSIDSGASVSLKSQLDSAEQFVRVMEKKNAWGDEERAVMQKMLDEVIVGMESVLTTENEADQQEFNTRKTTHEACLAKHTNKTHSSGALTLIHANVVKAKAKHKKCLKMKHSWQAYKTVANACVTDTDGLALGSVSDQHRTLATKMNSAIADTDTYAAAAPAGKADACTVDQMRYEEEICNLRVGTKNSCDVVDDCVTLVDLQALKTSIDHKAQNRQNLQHSIDILTCRINYLMTAFAGHANHSKYNTSQHSDSCGDLPVNTSAFVISTEVPTLTGDNKHETCTTGLAEPSLTDAAKCTTWRTEEYTWADHADVSACLHSCSYAAVPPASSVTETVECTLPGAYCFTHLNGQYATPPSSTSGYSGTKLDGHVTLNQGIQKWEVPQTGWYDILAFGGSTEKANVMPVRGNGAFVSARFSLTAGDTINIIVGQLGNYWNTNDGGSGGGGASWIWIEGADQPLLVAGGAGGSREHTVAGTQNGHSKADCIDGYLLGNPKDTHCNNNAAGGWSYGAHCDGGGGAGWTRNGDIGGENAEPGYMPTNNAEPGRGGDGGGCGGHGEGGFGGGGAAGYDAGGGGGGYIGGDGGTYSGQPSNLPGTGGSSYVDESAVSQSVGGKWSDGTNGKVTIVLVA